MKKQKNCVKGRCRKGSMENAYEAGEALPLKVNEYQREETEAENMSS